jgi:hypothetical protein
MHKIENILNMLDYSLGTKRKRHIAGGILLSVSLLFGGLAFTVMSLKMEEKNKCLTE